MFENSKNEGKRDNVMSHSALSHYDFYFQTGFKAFISDGRKMRWILSCIQYLCGVLSIQFWGRLSDSMHIVISRSIASFYNTRISRFLIKPYCLWQYGDPFYYKNFTPGGGGDSYRNFQDFFTREFPRHPKIESDRIWPCEGLLCEAGKVSEISDVQIKGEVRNIKTIFGKAAQLPDEGHYSNVFLHNNNYHHIHVPVDGVVDRIEHIPGKLLFLRPWAYKNKSIPALTNERVNVDIVDKKGRRWFMSIVGGPLVATIKMAQGIQLNADVRIGQKLASFNLGSTCCMISPVAPEASVGQMVEMGDKF